MDDPREAPERAVLREALVNDLLERAPAAIVLVGVLCARCIEADRCFTCLEIRDVCGLDEENLGPGIHEPPNQPGRRGPVDVYPLPGDPFHDGSAPLDRE